MTREIIEEENLFSLYRQYINLPQGIPTLNEMLKDVREALKKLVGRTSKMHLAK